MMRAAEAAAHRHDECCTVAVGTFTARCLNLLAALICMTNAPHWQLHTEGPRQRNLVGSDQSHAEAVHVIDMSALSHSWGWG